MSNEVIFVCPVCGEKMVIEYEGDVYEGHLGTCNNCHLHVELSSYGLDDMMEEQNADYTQLHNIIQNYINKSFKRLHDEYKSSNGRIIMNRLVKTGDKIRVEFKDTNRYNEAKDIVKELGANDLVLNNGKKVLYNNIIMIRQIGC